MKSYKELTVWQKSFNLALEVYRLTKNFPREEIYGLVNQIRRAAITIPSNIAEGYCRQHQKEYIQFLTIAFASGGELETQLLIAKELKFLKEIEFKQLNDLLSEVMKMLNVLIRKIKINSSSSP